MGNEFKNLHWNVRSDLLGHFVLGIRKYEKLHISGNCDDTRYVHRRG